MLGAARKGGVAGTRKGEARGRRMFAPESPWLARFSCKEWCRSTVYANNNKKKKKKEAAVSGTIWS